MKKKEKGMRIPLCGSVAKELAHRETASVQFIVDLKLH